MAAYKSGTDDLYVFTEVNENGGETEYFDVCLDGSCEDTDEISYKSTDLILFTTMLISFSAVQTAAKTLFLSRYANS